MRDLRRKKRWIVKLSQEERKQLETLINKGKVAGYKIKHAHIPLKADESENGPAWSVARIAEAYNVHKVRFEICENGWSKRIGSRTGSGKADQLYDRTGWRGRSQTDRHRLQPAAGGLKQMVDSIARRSAGRIEHHRCDFPYDRSTRVEKMNLNRG